MYYSWDFGVIWEFREALLKGLGVSLALTAAAIVSGTAIAVPITLGLVARNPVVRSLTTLAVQIVRSVPLLVALVFSYYLFPVVIGIKLSAFTAAYAVFTINLAAFAADVLRGGIVAIPREHFEAGMALGMTRFMVLRRITIPETFRRSMAALTALYISLFKYSSLASVISVSELMRTADLIVASRFKPLEIYLAVAGAYIAVVVPLSYLARWIERHPSFDIAPAETLHS